MNSASQESNPSLGLPSFSECQRTKKHDRVPCSPCFTSWGLYQACLPAEEREGVGILPPTKCITCSINDFCRQAKQLAGKAASTPAQLATVRDVQREGFYILLVSGELYDGKELYTSGVFRPSRR